MASLILVITFEAIKENTNRVGEPQRFLIGIEQSSYENGMIEIIIGELNKNLIVSHPKKLINSDSLSAIVTLTPEKPGTMHITGVVKEQILVDGERKSKKSSVF